MVMAISPGVWVIISVVVPAGPPVFVTVFCRVMSKYAPTVLPEGFWASTASWSGLAAVSSFTVSVTLTSEMDASFFSSSVSTLSTVPAGSGSRTPVFALPTTSTLALMPSRTCRPPPADTPPLMAGPPDPPAPVPEPLPPLPPFWWEPVPPSPPFPLGPVPVPPLPPMSSLPPLSEGGVPADSAGMARVPTKPS